MIRDDRFEFRLRPGRVRDRGGRSTYRSRFFVAQVMAAAAKANGGPLSPLAPEATAEQRRTSSSEKGKVLPHRPGPGGG